MLIVLSKNGFDDDCIASSSTSDPSQVKCCLSRHPFREIRLKSSFSVKVDVGRENLARVANSLSEKQKTGPEAELTGPRVVCGFLLLTFVVWNQYLLVVQC